MPDTRLKRQSRLAIDEEISFMPISDMFVGIIFIFLIIFASFWLQINSTERSLEVQIRTSLETRNAILHQIQDNISLPNNVTTIINERVGGIAFIAKHGFFDSGYSEPSAKGEKLFQSLSSVLEPILRCHSASHLASNMNMDCGENQGLINAILIEGHADATKMGINAKYKSNLELSAARAAEAYDQILTTTENFLQFKNENNEPLLGVSAYGDTRPIEESLRIPYQDKKQHISQDRRIEIRVIMATPVLAQTNQ